MQIFGMAGKWKRIYWSVVLFWNAGESLDDCVMQHNITMTAQE